MVIYETKITKIGVQAQELAQIGLAIIFNEDAPPELAEISFLHTIEELKGEVERGDFLVIDGQLFEIEEVGSEVNKNLQLLGHCTLKFENVTSLLPGDIRLKGVLPNIKIGTILKIYRKDGN
ncbi:PTS system, glucitol/sorbitol-specific IIA component [Thermoanaerobacter uzonensis DSM 18761]|uniref:PTS system, glucitol/sorbitol-specific IIA component n=1 Tax=Thermoanaerobacter uzonensis DSM 18761 TaxID=1123369 RepID=A0A1M4XWQ0_9THEO|nr:PTS glucitol/sorbitol transporter subunit IIA [Thermoanaerobacter uzonensis]SHE97911.1 PTS system, glucitol/sorbitol-specific IIA component [Thermoanaerobacter uzonensis DSM 18761]